MFNILCLCIITYRNASEQFCWSKNEINSITVKSDWMVQLTNVKYLHKNSALCYLVHHHFGTIDTIPCLKAKLPMTPLHSPIRYIQTECDDSPRLRCSGHICSYLNVKRKLKGKNYGILSTQKLFFTYFNFIVFLAWFILCQ